MARLRVGVLQLAKLTARGNPKTQPSSILMPHQGPGWRSYASVYCAEYVTSLILPVSGAAVDVDPFAPDARTAVGASDHRDGRQTADRKSRRDACVTLDMRRPRSFREQSARHFFISSTTTSSTLDANRWKRRRPFPGLLGHICIFSLTVAPSDWIQ